MSKHFAKIGLCLILAVAAQVADSQSFELILDFDEICVLQDVNGVSVADYDVDGDLDIFVVSIHQYEQGNPQTWSRLLRNDRVAGFADVTDEALLRSKSEFLRNGWMGDRMSASWGDFDNDGFSDLFLANNGYDELWRNLGNGQFENVTELAGIRGCANCYSSNGLWWDYDLDGDLDLYVSDWLKVNRQYRNEGNGTFIDVTEDTGLGDTSKTWASIPIDVNQDTLPDLYVVNDFGDNFLFLNQQGKFQEATARYGLADDGDGMGVDICDFNNDGHFDIYVTNIYRHRPNPLFVGKPSGVFSEQAEVFGIENTGWGWGARFFDADHDLDEDLYVVNGMSLSAGRGDKNIFFKNSDGMFLDLSENLGVDNVNEARGLEVFDFDLDGDIDMLAANRGEHPSFYKNTLIEKNLPHTNWIQIWLKGTTSNKNAFGSVVKISCQGDKYVRHYSGANLFGQSIKPIHFGLAHHSMIDEIEVIWPNGTREFFTSIDANQRIEIIEGTGSDQPSFTTGIHDVENNQLHVFPNPFDDKLQIQLNSTEGGDMEFHLYDMIGRKTFQTRRKLPGSETVTIDLHDSKMSPGLYFYSLGFSSGTKTGILIKQ